MTLFVTGPFVTREDLAGASGSSADGIAALSTLTRRSFSADRTYLRVTVVPDDTLKAEQHSGCVPQAVALDERPRASWLKLVRGGSQNLRIPLPAQQPPPQKDAALR